MEKNISEKGYRLPIAMWSVERAVFLVAGIFITLSVIIGIWWYFQALYFTLFVGLMLIQFSLTGWCPMAIIVKRVTRYTSLGE